MSLTEQEIAWDGLCAQVCESCMGYGEPGECGYHESELPEGTYICPRRQGCPDAQGCGHAVYHEPDDDCDEEEVMCMGVGGALFTCVEGDKCPRCGKRADRGGYCYECQEWVSTPRDVRGE